MRSLAPQQFQKQIPVLVNSPFRNLACKRSSYVTEKDAQEKPQKPPGRRQPVWDYLKIFCPWWDWMRVGRRRRWKVVSYFQSSDLRRQGRGKVEVQFTGYSVSKRWVLSSSEMGCDFGSAYQEQSAGREDLPHLIFLFFLLWNKYVFTLVLVKLSSKETSSCGF